MNSTSQSKSQFIIDLKSKIENLRKELLGLLNEWYCMVNIEQPRLEFLYESVFGDLEIELEQKSKAVTELERKVELLSLKIRKGERINKTTIDSIDNMISNESVYSSFTGSNTYSDFNFTSNDTSFSNDYSYEYSSNAEEIPQLYRTIVKKLHPDIAGDSEYFQKYWNSVQEAYKTNDLNRLRLFKKTLCPEVKINDSNADQEITLIKEARELEQSIYAERRKISQLKVQEPFTLSDKLNDNRWISRRRRMLRERLFHIDRKIQFNKKLISNLTCTVDNNRNYRSPAGSYRTQVPA